MGKNLQGLAGNKAKQYLEGLAMEKSQKKHGEFMYGNLIPNR